MIIIINIVYHIKFPSSKGDDIINDEIDSTTSLKKEDLTGQKYRNIRSQALVTVIHVYDMSPWGRYFIDYEYDNSPGVKFSKSRSNFLLLFKKV